MSTQTGGAVKLYVHVPPTTRKRMLNLLGRTESISAFIEIALNGLIAARGGSPRDDADRDPGPPLPKGSRGREHRGWTAKVVAQVEPTTRKRLLMVKRGTENLADLMNEAINTLILERGGPEPDYADVDPGPSMPTGKRAE